MQRVRYLTASLFLMVCAFGGSAMASDDVLEDEPTTSPYYKIDPNLIMDTLVQKTGGKINSINNLTMYVGKDWSAFQFCTPKENEGRFVYGYIVFDVENTLIEWNELPVMTDLGARAECDIIAQEDEPRLVEFELSDVTGLACVSNTSGVFCKPYI